MQGDRFSLRPWQRLCAALAEFIGLPRGPADQGIATDRHPLQPLLAVGATDEHLRAALRAVLRDRLRAAHCRLDQGGDHMTSTTDRGLVVTLAAHRALSSRTRRSTSAVGIIRV